MVNSQELDYYQITDRVRSFDKLEHSVEWVPVHNNTNIEEVLEHPWQAIHRLGVPDGSCWWQLVRSRISKSRFLLRVRRSIADHLLRSFIKFHSTIPPYIHPCIHMCVMIQVHTQERGDKNNIDDYYATRINIACFTLVYFVYIIILFFNLLLLRVSFVGRSLPAPYRSY